MLAARAAVSAEALKLSSKAEQMTRPSTTGTNDNITRRFDDSERMNHESMTVNTGAADLTVSANETGANQRAMRPNKSVENLRHPTKTSTLENWSLRHIFLGDPSWM